MSEDSKTKPIRSWIQPVGVAAIIAAISAGGGFLASRFLMQKPLSSEEKHAAAGEESSETWEKYAPEKTSSDDASTELSAEDSDSTGSVKSDSRVASEKGASTAGLTGSRSSEINRQTDPSNDPFSEEALDLEAPPATSRSSSVKSGTSSNRNETGKNWPIVADQEGDESSQPQTTQSTATDNRASRTSTAATAGKEASSRVSDSHAERKGSGRGELASAAANDATMSREDRITQQTVNYMSMADEQFAAGNYVEAMRAYQALRKKSDGVPGSALLFRLALCAEAAGRHAAAIEAYRKISGIQTDPAWIGVARYGEARCLAAMQRHEGLQTDLLRRAILDDTELLPTVRSEVLHLIGRDLWREQSSMLSINLLDDRTLLVPEWSPDPVRLLDELPLLIHESPLQRRAIEFQVLSVEETDPDGVAVRLQCGLTRMETLLRKLVEGCRLAYEITPEALSVLEGRSQQVAVSDRSLALLLDGLTIPWGLAWKARNGKVQIVHKSELAANELRESRLAAAERVLRIAVIEGVNSTQIGHSRLALGALLFEQKRAQDAVQFLQVQVESDPRSVVATEAGFNLGKCLMNLNQREESKLAFLRSIDSSGGLIDVKVASYIFHCRLLLEEGQHKLAIVSMMRGVALSEGSELEPWAALQLASGYLLDNVPQGANAVLMNHTKELEQSDVRAAGAFVSSLARFRAAVLSDRREREGGDVVAALAAFQPEKACGAHWFVLVAGACDELGLTQQSTEAYTQALRKFPQCSLRDKTALKLALHYQSDQQPEEARLLLTSLTSSEVDQLSAQARLQTARLALDQGRLDEAIILTRDLFLGTESLPVQRSALRIMGKAFERQQNHLAAIYCFSGALPEEVMPTQMDESALPNEGDYR